MKLVYHTGRPYYSTLTGLNYPNYDEAFHDSLRNGGGAYIDFNLYEVHEDGSVEIVF